MSELLTVEKDGWAAVRAYVFGRDQICLSQRDPEERRPCKGVPTLQHVKEEPMMGKKAPNDTAHLVMVCQWHHTENGWATSRSGLAVQRAYLAWRYPEVWGP